MQARRMIGARRIRCHEHRRRHLFGGTESPVGILGEGSREELPPGRELGPSVVEHRERKQYDLWDSWPLFALIVIVAGAEWILRKRERLP